MPVRFLMPPPGYRWSFWVPATTWDSVLLHSAIPGSPGVTIPFSLGSCSTVQATSDFYLGLIGCISAAILDFLPFWVWVCCMPQVHSGRNRCRSACLGSAFWVLLRFSAWNYLGGGGVLRCRLTWVPAVPAPLDYLTRLPFRYRPAVSPACTTRLPGTEQAYSGGYGYRYLVLPPHVSLYTCADGTCTCHLPACDACLPAVCSVSVPL